MTGSWSRSMRQGLLCPNPDRTGGRDRACDAAPPLGRVSIEERLTLLEVQTLTNHVTCSTTYRVHGSNLGPSRVAMVASGQPLSPGAAHAELRMCRCLSVPILGQLADPPGFTLSDAATVSQSHVRCYGRRRRRHCRKRLVIQHGQRRELVTQDGPPTSARKISSRCSLSASRLSSTRTARL